MLKQTRKSSGLFAIERLILNGLNNNPKNWFKIYVQKNLHCVKSVRIRSFSGPFFPAFGLNMEGYSVSLRIQFESGKVRTRKTPNTDTFHAVLYAAGKLKANCCL